MTCKEAFQAILEAEPIELSGEGETTLAEHIRGCARCRALALTVLQEETALGSGLSAMMPEPDLDRVLEAAGPSVPRFRPGSLTLIPLALAAGLAALFVAREPRLPGEPYVPVVQESIGLDVEAPAGRNVAVLDTENPDIKVVWLF